MMRMAVEIKIIIFVFVNENYISPLHGPKEKDV